MSINEEKLQIWCNQVDKRLDRLEGKNHKSDEPLIKDEQIRKVIRAWAEANGEDEETRLEYCHEDNQLRTGTDCIEFNQFTPFRELKDGATYTIAELCGEEALITKTSDCEYREVKEVNSIEDILKIHPKVVLEKIDDAYIDLFGEEYKGFDMKIEIYDDWRE